MPLFYSPKSPIKTFIDHQGFVLLDGGLATELEKRGHDLNHKLWSAKLLINDPQEIRSIHLTYLEAGADCIITSTYQASIPGFTAEGMTEKEARLLIQKAVQIADEARAQYLENSKNENQPGIRPLVAASVGPYGAYLADGSEFRGNYAASTKELHCFHESRWEILIDSLADIFAIETIPSYREAVVLREILHSTPDVFAWISFSCKDGICINDGTPIAECVALFADCEQIVGIGVNCTAPHFISSLINRIAEGAPDKPIVVYPNSGEIFNENDKSWSCSADPLDFGAAAVEWFNLGARLLGGCCRTSPKQIAEMRMALLGLRRLKVKD